MSDTFKTFTRQELYELVWTKPITKILLEYNTTNKSFKEVCQKNDIPLPKNGYWQKLKFNKNVEIIPLSESDKEYGEIILIEEGEETSELKQLGKKIEKNKDLPVKVTEKLSKPDEIIIRTRGYFKQSRKDKYPRRTEIPKEGIFSMDVSESIKNRTYRFADALIKLARKRGHDLKIITNHKYYNYNGTKLIIFDEYFDIRIRETNKRVIEENERGWKESKYYPTGKLCLKTDEYPRYEWTDSKTKSLEDKLPNILEYFELWAKRKKVERIENEKWHKEYEQKKRIEEELKQKRTNELGKFKSVINHSSRWQKAMDLRNYISVVESNAVKNNKLTLELQEWLKWVKDKADWYDPLIEKEDELFKDVDRDSI
jgi:hypothetical protein